MATRPIVYSRVSNVLKDEGFSGSTTKRPALPRCMKKVEHGDTPIGVEGRRLGRSLRDLITLLDELPARGVKFGRKPKLTPQQITHARKLIAENAAREWRGFRN
jgi:hypothetical protein